MKRVGRSGQLAALLALAALIGGVFAITGSDELQPDVAGTVETSSIPRANRLLTGPPASAPSTGRVLSGPVPIVEASATGVERPPASASVDGAAVEKIEEAEEPPSPIEPAAPEAPPTGSAFDSSADTPPLPAIASIATASHVAESAGTRIPVYDTAWQMLVRGTPEQADNYFEALRTNGFTGAWAGVIHHAPATYNGPFAGGESVGALDENGELRLTREYILHVRAMLDAAARHDMRVGLVPAWQNLYLPGGGADAGVASSNEVRGTITEDNARAYGRHIVEAFGWHPAVSMWVFGGDAGTNNTDANKAVWREMAAGVREAGSRLSITYHTPTSEFNQLNYAGEPWLDFIAPETGHGQDAAETEAELRTAKAVYGLPVWSGESRYHHIDFDWVPEAFRRPGTAEMAADALAAAAAGVSGYVYGDAGRWTWCAGFGDASPCNADDVASSFGEAERAVIDVFRN